jgi:hypothetical protein
VLGVKEVEVDVIALVAVFISEEDELACFNIDLRDAAVVSL